jgi:hypothetical protein
MRATDMPAISTCRLTTENQLEIEPFQNQCQKCNIFTLKKNEAGCPEFSNLLGRIFTDNQETLR